MLNDGHYNEVVLAAAESAMARYGSDAQWPAIERAAFGEFAAPPPPLPPAGARSSLAAPAPVARKESILSMLTPGSFGLEIGPSYNPLLPKAEGFNIETVDYADQAALRAKYAATVNVDIARIEVVDHVTNGRPLTETIPADRAYDFILASHVIEHTPDLIGFLADCARFLKPGGRLVLAVPGQALLLRPGPAADLPGRGAAGPRGAAHPAHADGGAGVGRLRRSARRRDRLVAAGGPPAGLRRHARQGDATRRARADLTGVCGRALLALRSSSFRLLIEDLRAVGKTTLREAAFRHHGAHEFFVALSADGAGPGLDRDGLAGLIADEVAMRRI